MNFSMILKPIIGSGIGYVTNYIAVKMLFRPLKPVKIGSYTLPFTPGMIPKEKPRLAKAIGEIVGARLVTKEALEEALLSDSLKTQIRQSVQTSLIQICNEGHTISDLLSSAIPSESVENLKVQASEEITNHILNICKTKDVGALLSEIIVASIKQQMQGSFLAMMLSDSLMSTIGNAICSGVNSYIDEHGEEMLKPMIENEIISVSNKPVSEVLSSLEKNDIYIEDSICKLYEKLITEKLNDALNALNIAALVEKQINDMDVLELENLLLQVMKKELNGIVNLGALIGFVLGLLNLLI